MSKGGNSQSENVGRLRLKCQKTNQHSYGC